jgi:hypothetical protein
MFCIVFCAKGYFYSRVFKNLGNSSYFLPQFVKVTKFCGAVLVCIFCFCGCRRGFSIMFVLHSYYEHVIDISEKYDYSFLGLDCIYIYIYIYIYICVCVCVCSMCCIYVSNNTDDVEVPMANSSVSL